MAGRNSGFTPPLSPQERAKLGRTTTTAYVATATKTVVNSLTETSIIPSGKGSLVVPGAILVEGTTFDFDSSGLYSTGLTGLLSLRVKLGSLVTASLMSLDLPKTGTNLKWYARGRGTVRSGNVLVTQAFIDYEDLTGKLVTEAFSETTVTVDPTTNYTTDYTAQWSLAVLQNSFTVTQLRLMVTPPPA